MGGVRGKETCGGYRAILPCRIRHSLTSYPPLNPRKGQRGGREVEGLGLEGVGRVPYVLVGEVCPLGSDVLRLN